LIEDPLRRRDDELVEQCVKTVGQILSNYQAALHLLEEAAAGGFGETVPPALGFEVLRRAARDVFAPVLDACARVSPGLDDLVRESIGSADDPPPPAHALRDVVVAERQRLAVTHSRLITRQAGLMKVARQSDTAALVSAARRLQELESGSHSAGALFNVLVERWKDAR